MWVAVAGAGWCGVLLSNKLTEYGRVEVFERNQKPTAICGCAIPTTFFNDLAKTYGLNPEDYICWKANRLIVNFGKNFCYVQIGNLCIFNKQKFMEDLVNQSSATFHFRKKFPNETGKYDLIVDASGTREVLGKLATDQFYLTYQVKAKLKTFPTQTYTFNLTVKTKSSYGCFHFQKKKPTWDAPL